MQPLSHPSKPERVRHRIDATRHPFALIEGRHEPRRPRSAPGCRPPADMERGSARPRPPNRRRITGTRPDDVAGTPQGRVVVSSRPLDGPVLRVREVMPDGELRAFPPEDRAAAPDGADDATGPTAVIRVAAAGDGTVRMLDMGPEAQPQLVGRDGVEDALAARIGIGAVVPRPNSSLRDLAPDEAWARGDRRPGAGRPRGRGPARLRRARPGDRRGPPGDGGRSGLPAAGPRRDDRRLPTREPRGGPHDHAAALRARPRHRRTRRGSAHLPRDRRRGAAPRPHGAGGGRVPVRRRAVARGRAVGGEGPVRRHRGWGRGAGPW